MGPAPCPRFQLSPSSPIAAPVPPEERAKQLIDPGFGKVFTDHMAIVEYEEGRGWHDAKITARGALIE